MANLRILDARGRSAGVLAGWPGARLAAEPPNPQHSLLTRARASLAFGGGDAAEPAGGDASAPSATLAQTLKLRPFRLQPGVERFPSVGAHFSGRESLLA